MSGTLGRKDRPPSTEALNRQQSQRGDLRVHAHFLRVVHGERRGAEKHRRHGGRERAEQASADQPGQESNEGKILYIKSSLTGAAKYEDIELPSEPADVVNFKFMHKHFPHDTTANQWFTESQFESYRRLGYHVIDEIQRSGQWEQFC